MSSKTRTKNTPKQNGMLVLSRKKDESISIGDDIRIVVVDVRGDKVRIGIDAPRNVKVLRAELQDK